MASKLVLTKRGIAVKNVLIFAAGSLITAAVIMGTGAMETFL